MADHQELRDELTAGYSFADDGVEPPAAVFGRALAPDLDDVLADVPVRLPLRMLNRHGLIAGATGTGKTKTLQLFAEQLSEQGVPVFLADLKGDLTGLADPAPPGDVDGFLAERMTEMGFEVGDTHDGRTAADAPDSAVDPPLWRPRGFPVELLSLTGDEGHPLRVPLREFGALLLAKVMDCTDVQESVLEVLWQLAEDQQEARSEPFWALETLDHLDDLLRFVATSEEGDQLQDEYGGMSTQTLNVLRRKLVQLKGQADDLAEGGGFFGAPGFDVRQLWAPREDEPFGVISILRLVGVQSRPRLFSTFLMWLLSAVYANADELGDPDRPRMVFFFDEAHLLFEGASNALLELVELTVRMIRSKGIGVFFVTQQPTDLPDDVLAQLGTRVQHALRAFTPNDQAALEQTARTYPVTEHYDVRETLTGLGIGEALVVGLGRKGAPTPTVATRLVGPRSAMDPVDDERLGELVAASRERLGGAAPVASAATDADVEADPTAPTGPPAATPRSAEELATTAAPTPELAAATTAVQPAPGELARSLAFRCRLVRAGERASRTVNEGRVTFPSSPRRGRLQRDVEAVADGLGQLVLTEDQLRFTGPGGELVLPRAELDELRWLHGLVVVGEHAFLLDPDDLSDLLGAFHPPWGADDLTALDRPPDHLLDELATLDGQAVAAAVEASGGAVAAPAPSAEQRIERPAPAAAAAERRGNEETADPDDEGSGLDRVADAASSPVVEEVAATGLKMLGINKGTTRSVFRAFRRARR